MSLILAACQKDRLPAVVHASLDRAAYYHPLLYVPISTMTPDMRKLRRKHEQARAAFRISSGNAENYEETYGYISFPNLDSANRIKVNDGTWTHPSSYLHYDGFQYGHLNFFEVTFQNIYYSRAAYLPRILNVRSPIENKYGGVLNKDSIDSYVFNWEPDPGNLTRQLLMTLDITDVNLGNRLNYLTLLIPDNGEMKVDKLLVPYSDFRVFVNFYRYHAEWLGVKEGLLLDLYTSDSHMYYVR